MDNLLRKFKISTMTLILAGSHHAVAVQAQDKEADSTKPPASTCGGTATEGDWVPYDQLPLDIKKSQPFYSCGAYVEPDRPGKYFTGDNNTEPTVAYADESTYDENDVATLTGRVKILQGSRQFEGRHAALNTDNNLGDFAGDVRIREQGLLVEGTKGNLDLNSGKAEIEDSHYVMHESNARGTAVKAVRQADKSLLFTDATYTTCPPNDSGWLLSGSQVDLNVNTGRGEVNNAILRVHNVPILYSPYLSFPIDSRRQSGFLFPNIGYGSDTGFDFGLPYYFNLAPNYDATVTPRYMSRRGESVEGEFRYLTEHSQGEFGGSTFINKDRYREENPYYNERRWFVNFNHKTQFTPRWQAEMRYAKASDKNYLEDFGTDLNVMGETQLNQRFFTTYHGGDRNHNWQAGLNVQAFQNMSQTSNDPYNKLPQLTLDGTWFAQDWLTLNYKADYTRFDRTEEWDYRYEKLINPSDRVFESVYGSGYGIERANGQRLFLESGISTPFKRSYGFITPSLKVQHVQYQLANLEQDETIKDLSAHYQGFNASDYTNSPHTTVPVISLDTGLYFDRPTQFGSLAMTQTLEPRLKYLYSPYVDGQGMQPIFDTALMGFSYSSLWQDSRFSGYDRLGDMNQLSVGVTSRWIENSGFERAQVSVGQQFYFQDRQLWINPLAGSPSAYPENEDDWNSNLSQEGKDLWDEMHYSRSPIASQFIYNINQSSSIRQDFTWDTNKKQVDKYGIYFQYRPDIRHVMNVGYRYLPQVERYMKDSDGGLIRDPNSSTGYKMTGNDLSQIDVSTAWPLLRNWSGLGRWQYDITNRRNLELLTGLEYNNCCYQVRFMWRKWIDDDNNIDHPDYKCGVMVQFVLRGLGGLSSGSVNKYLDGIKGYATNEK